MREEDHLVVLCDGGELVVHNKRAKFKFHIERPELAHNHLW